MLQKNTINAARRILREKGIAGLSISSVEKESGYPKRSIVNEFENIPGLLCSLLNEDLLIRYNLGTNILEIDQLNSYEKVCLYYAVGVIKTIRNQHDRGSLFLMQNPSHWKGLSDSRRNELDEILTKHFYFVERVINFTPEMNKSDLTSKEIAIKLSCMERGFLVCMLGIVSPIKSMNEKEFLTLLSKEISNAFNVSNASIRENEVYDFVNKILISPPEWALLYKDES